MYEVIDSELSQRSVVVSDKDTGNLKRQEAWERIDELLDMRNELGKLVLSSL